MSDVRLTAQRDNHQTYNEGHSISRQLVSESGIGPSRNIHVQMWSHRACGEHCYFVRSILTKGISKRLLRSNMSGLCLSKGSTERSIMVHI